MHRCCVQSNEHPDDARAEPDDAIREGSKQGTWHLIHSGYLHKHLNVLCTVYSHTVCIPLKKWSTASWKQQWLSRMVSTIVEGVPLRAGQRPNESIVQLLQLHIRLHRSCKQRLAILVTVHKPMPYRPLLSDHAARGKRSIAVNFSRSPRKLAGLIPRKDELSARILGAFF